MVSPPPTTHDHSMLIPYGDDNSQRHRAPVVVPLLIAANAGIFLYQEFVGGPVWTNSWAAIPAEILGNQDLVDPVGIRIGEQREVIVHGPGPSPIQLTLLSSMFLHGGWLHLLGNMLFLWICGDQIEDRLGRLRFLVFYLLGGLVAGLCHVLTSMSGLAAQLPCIGASGAVAAVLGAYFLRYPFNHIKVFALLIIIPLFFTVPALVVLGLWLVKEIASAYYGTGGNVAVMAHIGGFIAGIVLAILMEPDKPRRMETPWSQRLRRVR
jgi:membrane associated rhomboid family serine protease